jgi:hypothetical protein
MSGSAERPHCNQLIANNEFTNQQRRISIQPYVSNLFAYVEKEHLIEGFRAPAIQSKRLTVPNLLADSTMLPEKEEEIDRMNPGCCGRLIK